jgi:transposase-like protein
MGRKSKLSEAQWADVGRRLLEGESICDLAREHGISEATVRSHFERAGAKTKNVKEVAQLLVDADTAKQTAQQALKELPPDAQVTALNLAAKLRSISESLACGAELGAKSFRRLQALASGELQKVEDAKTMDSEVSVVALKNVGVATALANECSKGALNLLAANRETVRRINDDDVPPEDQPLTPERIKDGARRIAFTLQRAAHQQHREAA